MSPDIFTLKQTICTNNIWQYMEYTALYNTTIFNNETNNFLRNVLLDNKLQRKVFIIKMQQNKKEVRCYHTQLTIDKY